MEETYNIDNLHILVIDDDQWVRRILTRHLNLWGFKVISALDPYTAVKESLKIEYSVILLDFYLPDINGDILLKLFRKLDNTFETPIIIMSANMDKNILASTYRNGANGFISKPITLHTLSKKIQEFMPIKIFRELTEKYKDLRDALIEPDN